MRNVARGFARVSTVVNVLIYLLIALVVLTVVLFLWASSGDNYVSAEEPGLLLTRVGDAPPTAEAEFTVMSFNIGYGRGPLGDLVGPWTREQITTNLDGIASQIESSGASIAALQEVDLAAERTHDINEADYLLDKLGWRYGSCVVTWEKNYVPYPYWPPSRHYGRMKTGSCLLSRYPVTATTRIPLPQPDQPFWRNRLYFQRAIDRSELLIQGQVWVIFNVHLEAFDQENRHAQAEILQAAIQKVGHPRVLVIGDFNAIEETAVARTAYADEPEMDFTGDLTLRKAFRDLAFFEALAGRRDVFTFPAVAPTRRLDYIFYTGALERLDATVFTPSPAPWSDHLPIVARFRFAGTE